MKPAHIFYLSAQGMSIYCCRRGTVMRTVRLDDSAAGLQALALHLQQSQPPPGACLLLVNLASEDFQRETIPLLRGRNRQSMITRRLAQHFPDTPYTCVTSLGVEKDPGGLRKNEHLLLSALTESSRLAPWLALLQQHAVPLAGIYSLSRLMAVLVPVLQSVLPKELQRFAGPCVWLTPQDQSLREGFFLRQQLQLSRWVSLAGRGGHDETDHQLPAVLAREAQALRQYLLAQRLIESTDALPVITITELHEIPALQRYSQESRNFRFHFLNSHACARRIGLKHWPAGESLESLYVYWLAKNYTGRTGRAGQLLPQFAPPDLLSLYRQQQGQRRILQWSGFALLASFLLALSQLSAAWQANDAAQALNTQIQVLQQKGQNRRAADAQPGFSYAALEWLSQQQARLAPSALPFESVLLQLGRTLDAHPHISISRIEWHDRRHQESIAAEKYIARITGDLLVVTPEKLRQTADQFEAFIRTLGAEQTFAVTVLQAPVEPGRSLQTPPDFGGVKHDSYDNHDGRDKQEMLEKLNKAQHKKPFLLTISMPPKS